MKFIVILLIFIVTSCSYQSSISVPTSTTIPFNVNSVVLIDIEGEVLVNEFITNESVKLQQGDIIVTKADSEATIIFFDSSRTRLWDNTSIVIQKIENNMSRSVQLKQISGEIWTRLLRISGVSTFDVVTPNAIASVRGTGFWVAIQNGSTAIGVTEGKVDLKRIVNGEEKSNRLVEKDQQIFVDENMTIKPLVHDDFINENLQKDDEFINSIRNKIGNKTFYRLMSTT